MKNSKNLILALVASSSLMACNSGGGGSSSGSDWNSGGIGGGGVDNVNSVIIQSNNSYGVSWKRGSGQVCLSQTPYGTNNWSNVRCDGNNTMGYTVDENGNVFLVKSVQPYNPDSVGGTGKVETDVYITDANGNQIGETLHTCQNPTRYDPANVACVYPPYYTGDAFVAKNGKIYFGGGNGIHSVSYSANMNTIWDNNVIDPTLGALLPVTDNTTWGAAYSWAIGNSGTMYIDGQWAGVYKEGNWTNYIGQSNGGGQASWNAYINSYLPIDPDPIGGTSSDCSNSQIWEYQQYVMSFSSCQFRTASDVVRAVQLRGLVKNNFAGNWVVFNPDLQMSKDNDEIMYLGYQNTLFAVKMVQQGTTGLAQLVVKVENIVN